MKNVALELNKRYKLSLSSFTQAAREFQARGIGGTYDFDTFMVEVLGEVVPTKHAREAEVMAGYIVQESVRNHLLGAATDPHSIIAKATEMTTNYFVNHPWDLPKEIVAVDGGEIFVPTRAKRAPKGSGKSKKELAIQMYNANRDKSRPELLAMFVKELGMTPPGASTYVHNCQRGLWK